MNRRAFCYLAAVLATLVAATSAHAQANILFSGGNGTRLSITLLQPVSYTITVSGEVGDAPFFVLDGAGEKFDDHPSLSGTINFSINGGANQFIDTIGSGFAGANLTADDAYLFGLLPGLSVGDKVTLNAGTLTTTDAFAGPPPASGSYSTFIVYGDGRQLSTFGTAVPEPSTWIMLGVGASGLGLAASRWRCMSKRA